MRRGHRRRGERGGEQRGIAGMGCAAERGQARSGGREYWRETHAKHASHLMRAAHCVTTGVRSET